MAIYIEKVDILNDKKARKRFIDVQFNIYKDDKYWVPQLRMELNKLFTHKHPFYQTAQCAFYIAIKDGKDVGRIMAINNHNYNQFHKTLEGHWGFFEAIEDIEVFKALFNSAMEWTKSLGLAKFVGPFNPSTNYECGTLIKGHNEIPVLMMMYNYEYYHQYLNELGFTKAKDLLAYHMKSDFEMPEVIKKIALRAEEKANITYRTVSKKNWTKEIDLMYSIYNDAWEQNWGFVPMTKDEFYAMAADLKTVADEKLVLFALVNGEVAGFIVCLPDFNQVLHKIPDGKLFPKGIFQVLRAPKLIDGVRVITMGVKKKYRLYGLESILYYRCHENIKQYKKYKNVEMSWILEDNLNMNKPLIRMNAIPYRTYRIFQKEL